MKFSSAAISLAVGLQKAHETVAINLSRGLQATPTPSQKVSLAEDEAERLGNVIAISPDGTHLLAGELYDTKGQAHLFSKDGNGSWIHRSRHYSSNPHSHGVYLGYNVATMSNDWIFLGAVSSSVRTNQQCAAFKRNSDGSWPATETVKLNIPPQYSSASLGVSISHGDQFGSGIAVDGDTLVVGASKNSPPGCADYHGCGAAFVYERDGDTWNNVARLLPEFSAYSSRFGDHDGMVVRGDEIFIGVSYHGCIEHGHEYGCGRIYIYKKTGGDWPENATSIIDNPNPAKHYFAGSVSLSPDGNLLAVGAGSGGGRVYLYKRNQDGSWPATPVQTLFRPTPSIGDDTHFGNQVALQGNTLAVGSPTFTPRRSVFVYHFNDDEDAFSTTPSYQLLTPGNPCYHGCDNIGYAVTLDTNGNVIASNDADQCDDPTRDTGRCGAVYTFSNPAYDAVGPWAITETPTASPTQAPTIPGPIDALNLTAVTSDFRTKSAVSLVYDVGVGRPFRYGLFKKGCDVAVNDTSLFDESHEVQQKDDIVQEVTLTYDFNLTAVENSDIYNSTSTTLEVCSKVEIMSGDSPIFFAEQEIIVDINLDANFTLDVGLEEALTKSANDTVNFQNAIRAFKCNTATFTEDKTELAPNEELDICIQITDSTVLINELVTMKSQQGEGDPVDIVSEGLPEVAAITSIEPPRGPTNQMSVTTRMPLNKITFAVNEELTVSGSVLLQFASRRLQSERKLRDLQGSVTDAEPQEAAFQVKVGLKPKSGIGDEVPMGSSAGYATSKYAAAFGLISVVILNLM